MSYNKNLNLYRVSEKLILVVSEHRQFGWKISIHLADPLPGDSLLLKGVPVVREEVLKGRTEKEVELIKMVNEISDEVLLKIYSKEKDKTKIPQNTIDNLIRPRIEQSSLKIFTQAITTNTPVYFRDNIKSKALSDYNRLFLSPNESRPIFNFIKDKNGLRYFISLTNEGDEVQLQASRTIILADNPCIILLGNTIYQVVNMEAKKLSPFFTKTHINVPSSSEKEYIQKFIIKTIPKYQVRIEGIEMKQRFPLKQGKLVLEEDFYQQLCFSLCYMYDERVINCSANRRVKIVGVEEQNEVQHIYWFNRDLDWEDHLQHTLVNLGLKRVGDRFYMDPERYERQRFGLIEWLNRHLSVLNEFTIEQRTGCSYYQGKVEIKSQLDVKIDWFDLNIEVVFEHCKIPFTRFKKHILSGNPEYILPDGRVFILPEEWFHQYRDFFVHSEIKGEKICVQKIHASLLGQSIDSFSLSDKRKEIDSLSDTPEEVAIPSGKLDQILRPYQRKGFYWLNHLRIHHFGGCLADDMGLTTTGLLNAFMKASFAANRLA